MWDIFLLFSLTTFTIHRSRHFLLTVYICLLARSLARSIVLSILGSLFLLVSLTICYTLFSSLTLILFNLMSFYLMKKWHNLLEFHCSFVCFLFACESIVYVFKIRCVWLYLPLLFCVLYTLFSEKRKKHKFVSKSIFFPSEFDVNLFAARLTDLKFMIFN